MVTNKCWRYTGFGVLGIIGLFAFTLVVMLLWNWLVPGLFKGPELTYWQTLGLLILSKILFSGIGHGSHHTHPREWSSHSRWDRERWRKKFEARMNGKAETGSTADSTGDDNT
jgi:hypothetical protein